MSQFRTRICPSVEAELDAARVAADQGNPAHAFARLERAHVLGQASTLLHVRVHWQMLLWGLRQRSAGEVLGQILRLSAQRPRPRLAWFQPVTPAAPM
jgi:hypothetical protein